MSALLSSPLPAAGAITPSLTIPCCSAEERRTLLTESVGTSLTPLLADEENEQHIRDCGWLMQCAMNRWEQSGCFAARGEADRWRIEMEAAIRARSAAQVVRLERVRGLA